MKRKTHPTPWYVEDTGSSPAICDREGDFVINCNGGHPRALTERIVKAVNAAESPVAKVERAVVKAAMSDVGSFPAYLERLDVACDRLLAARRKAKK